MPVRLPSFDCINAFRLEILKILLDKELDIGEIIALSGKKRSKVFYALSVLSETGLVKKKDCLKKTHCKYAHSENKAVTRYFVSPEGLLALGYFLPANRGVL